MSCNTLLQAYNCRIAFYQVLVVDLLVLRPMKATSWALRHKANEIVKMAVARLPLLFSLRERPSATTNLKRTMT